ncbi:MAG: ATP-dependent helicase HrpB [Bacteroidota bacterium]|nr:ATP-dependent helicase HrpB [Bacteroidota bacterium]
MSLPNNKFPIDEALPRLKAALLENNICILVAPPGAGKTTRVPPALIEEEWLDKKKIIMLEPRRIAAKRSAEFMSSQMGERCGQTIGYRIRSEACIGEKTRIEVVTEGILTRMLQSDAEMPETGLIIFDEFHERSIHADTGLAFILDVQKNIRPEIKVIIMSATPDTEKLLNLLGEVPIIESSGRAYPVETHYLKHNNDKRVEIKVAEATVSALKKEEGDILVFLPGKAEIKRTKEILTDRLNESEVIVHELYGEASREEQDAALLPSKGERRKVILATSIAETSLTIDGVRIVIDSGLSRISSFDIRRGMPGLMTVAVSKASADQRRGRAGRQAPGVCYRLWTKEEEALHPTHTQPEILTTDLAQLALELAQWGTPKAEGLLFIDRPPAANLDQASSVLFMLGATDKLGRFTQFGKRMCQLPVHPRFSAMILHAKDMGIGSQACFLAALFEERFSSPASKAESIDLNEKWYLLHNPNGAKEAALSKRVFQQARRLQKIAKLKEDMSDNRPLGKLLALAYPERTAKKVSGRQYQLAQGTVASLPEGSLLLREEFLAIGDVDAAGAVAKVFLAAPISSSEILEIFKDILTSQEKVQWADDAVRGKRLLKLGLISIQERDFTPKEEVTQKCIIEMLLDKGLDELPWNKESKSIVERSEWLRQNVFNKESKEYADWPVLTEESLKRTMEFWLSPFLTGIKRKKDLIFLDMKTVIRTIFSYEQLSFLEKEAPEVIKLPSGSSIKLKYDEGEKPVLAVRLQELFGQTDTPKVGGGKIPVLIHLLSPAMRPLAITQDLRSFWINIYPEILKQMKIKYPKHIWPDDPLSADPTNKTKRGNRLF